MSFQVPAEARGLLLKGSIEVSFIHYSLDLSEHLYICFNSLSGKSCKFILLGSFSVDLSCSLFLAWFSIFFSSLCWCFCIGQCRHLSQSSQIGLIQEEITTNKPGQGFLAGGVGGSCKFFPPQEESGSFLAWFLFSCSVLSLG